MIASRVVGSRMNASRVVGSRMNASRVITAATFRVLVVLWLSSVACHRTPAGEPSGLDLFEIHVRPSLLAHCVSCHGDRKQESGLDLSTREAMIAGGDSGAALVPHQPEQSLMISAIKHESFEMPPDQSLSEKTIRGIEAWVRQGAPWPAETTLRAVTELTDVDRNWWCYQPIADPPVPKVDDHGWCRNEIDHFVFARLQKEGIAPAEPAERNALVRRLSFAATGLPPSLSFLERSRSVDWQALVNEQLADPAFGEHHASAWFDLVRYADTDGYRADHKRPHAKLYRDYVIDSFNQDKPYRRFILEQLAGDEVDPGNRDALIGTMYLRHWIYEHNQRDVEGQWDEILNDVTETTADVFLGQGLKCARCHDHKFDPLLQTDFFRLRSFFAAILPREDMPIADAKTKKEFLEAYRHWDLQTSSLRQQIREIEQPPLLAHATREGFDKFVSQIKAMIRKWPADRTPYEFQIAAMASRQFDVEPEKLPKWLGPDQEKKRQDLKKQLAKYEPLRPKPLPTIAFVVSDVGPVAPPTHVLDDPSHTPVKPGFLSVISQDDAKIEPLPPELQTTGRRRALAQWMVDPKNPLTARVMVNRVWQHYFGRGLVENASDFGRLGNPPSHPMLLDWLATRFVRDGWSLKKLHRMILNSATFRQNSKRIPDESISSLDPDNRLLWRMESRRLSGEEIYDAMLFSSGELNASRRAVRQEVQRNKLDPLLANFDLPDRIRSQSKRHRTTTPTQALLLRNGKWVMERAKAIEKRFSRMNDAALIGQLYKTLFGRDPTPSQLAMGKSFLKDSGDAKPNRRVAMIHALLLSNEMVYVD